MDEQERAKAWKKALVADGWQPEKTYDQEWDLSYHYHRDGWNVGIYDQPAHGYRTEWYGSVCAWGPDELAVNLPETYDFEVMQAGLRTCGYCGKKDTDVVRLGFAGRACPDCREKLKAKVEYPGWTN